MQAFPRHRGAAETPSQVMNRRRSRDQQAEIARPERPNVCIPTRVLTRPNSVSWTESADASLLAVSELSRPGHPSPARIPNVLPQHKRRTLVSAWNCLWERNVAAHCGSSSKIDTARACHVPVSERVSARWGLRLGCFSIKLQLQTNSGNGGMSRKRETPAPLVSLVDTVSENHPVKSWW